jgi:hypothetical protein
MLSIPAFVAEKEKRSGKAFLHLLEIEYSDGQFVRYVRYDKPNSGWETEPGQWQSSIAPDGSPLLFEGVFWSPFPMSKPTRSESANGEIPVLDISISGVGREIASILEFYDIEQRPGRTVRVHPDHLADPTAKRESKFIVKSARVLANTAIITVTPLIFDPLATYLPRQRVSSAKFPGILGAGHSIR